MIKGCEMATDQFRPKPGHIRSVSGRKNQCYINRVVRDISRAAQPKFRNGRSSFSGYRSGRGYSVAVGQATRGFQPGRRRVVIKARFTRFKNDNLGAARAHLQYIQRDGVTRDGSPGELYDPDTDRADGKAFLAEAVGDRHQFRFIVAPEDGAQMDDLKPFIRDLMSQAENDLCTKLDWVAVDHFNTGHPHTHIVIRGKDELGEDLIIARDYISHGFRERARDLVTMELGPETRIELDRKLQSEMAADRFTRIDRSLLRDVEDGVLIINRRALDDHEQHSLKTGRLRKLETMGLAEELKPGIWKIPKRTKSVLRELGQHNDIITTMQRVLKESGLERGIAELKIFKSEDPTERITGKIISIGLSDEINNRHYVVVDGIDGKLHYADIGRLNEYDPPARELLVTLQGQSQNVQRSGRLNRQAQLFIESHASFERLATANGATWLDRQLVSKSAERITKHGFGFEVVKALRQRQQWLVQEGFMVEQNGRLDVRRRMLAVLTKRDVERSVATLERKLGMRHMNARDMWASGGTKISQSVRLASGRFAVLQRSNQFTLVPWQQVMRTRRGKGPDFETGTMISR